MARLSTATGRLTLLRRSRTPVAASPSQARLEAFPNPRPQRDYWITFHCPEFTALCPVTGQPDFGRITIRYVPDQVCLESKSLKLYLLAYRNTGTFHEAAVNRILDDLVTAIRPRRAIVIGEFNPRGGISITVEAAYPVSEGEPVYAAGLKAGRTKPPGTTDSAHRTDGRLERKEARLRRGRG